jgi:hypothetical protein
VAAPGLGEAAVDKWHLQPLGRITDSQWAGLDPAQMGLGPVHAATPILQRHQFALNDIDLWEINEAFAAQVLGCVAAWESDDYCREQLGCRARSARSRRIVSTSTAARLPSVTRSGLPARASSCICCMPARGQGQARHRGDLHRRWSGWRHARGNDRLTQWQDTEDKAWIARAMRIQHASTGGSTSMPRVDLGDARQGGESTNSLSSAVMDELAVLLDQFDRSPPQGLIFRSGKAAGFIAGADIQEFTQLDTPEKGASSW